MYISKHNFILKTITQNEVNMKLAQIVLFCMLLLSAAANPVLDGKLVETRMAYDDEQDPNSWQNSGKFEGDIILTQDQKKYLRSNGEHRNGAINFLLRWPNREIPYEISSDFTEKEKDFMESVLKEDFARSCVSVLPRKNETDYVYVTGKNPGCWSSVGRIGGKQQLNLDRKGCLYKLTIVHEFLHAAGFFHQQSATERDDFVKIQWENIETNMQSQFDKYPRYVVNNFGESYDYGSVMHYGAKAFSKNGEKTIVPIKENVEIGKATKLSEVDIAKLNRMYLCDLFKQ